MNDDDKIPQKQQQRRTKKALIIDDDKVSMIEQNDENRAMKIDSSDTLADVDMNFKDMRTCDGPCKEIMFSDQLEIFQCCHAVCSQCLNELTDIEIHNQKFSCSVSTCRHGNAERNVSSVKEYNYIKKMFLHSHSNIPYPPTAKLSTSQAEATISMVNILEFDSKHQSSSTTRTTTTETSDGNESASMTTTSSLKVISGTTLATDFKNEPKTLWTPTSPDFYVNSRSPHSALSLNAASMSDVSTAKNVTKKRSQVYPMNAAEYDEELIADLQALTSTTAKSCFNEDEFDDCTTAQNFSYANQ